MGLSPRDLWLDAILPHVAFDGWNETSFRRAAADLHLPYTDFQRLFPDGTAECADYFVRRGDAAMLKAATRYNFDTMKIRERIATCVMLRLQECAPHREAVRKTVAFYLMPHHSIRWVKALYHTVDDIWHAAGDTATDFNFYTKRMLLAGVYASTLLFWLDDDPPEYTATQDFLKRRIENVMSIQTAKQRIKALLDKTLPIFKASQ